MAGSQNEGDEKRTRNKKKAEEPDGLEWMNEDNGLEKTWLRLLSLFLLRELGPLVRHLLGCSVYSMTVKMKPISGRWR